MRAFPSQMKPLLIVDPIGPLMIDAPALAPKQNVGPPIAVPDARLRNLDDRQPQGYEARSPRQDYLPETQA